MNKERNLEIINLILGFEFNDINLSEPIAPTTIDKIQKLYEEYKLEQSNIEKITQKKEEALHSCLQALMTARTTNTKLKSIELLTIAETNNLSTLIQQLNSFIKKRGGLWILNKKQIKGEIYYYIDPS